MTDAELLDAYYSDGDNRWIGLLLQRYTLLLYGVCMKYLRNEEASRDAVQQVFLKVIGELPKYRVEYFKSWLFTVARNHCLMQLRDQGKRTVELNEQWMQPPVDSQAWQDKLDREQQLNLLEHALKELNEEQRTCVSLFYLEKKSYQQITEITGYNLLQVKSYIQNGKRNLKLFMEKKQSNSHG